MFAAIGIAYALDIIGLWVLFPIGAEFGLNWRPYRDAAWLGVSLALVSVPLLGAFSIIWAVKSKSELGALGGIGILGVSFVLTIPTFVVWWVINYGVGSSETVAELSHMGYSYRLEREYMGDPQYSTDYRLRKCTADGLWCREYGVVFVRESRGADELVGELELDLEGAIHVYIGGQDRAILQDDRVQCLQQTTSDCGY